MRPSLALIVVGVLAFGGVHGQDSGKDRELLQGTWVMTSREFMGKKASEEEIKKIGTRIVFQGDAVTISTLDAGEYAVTAELGFKLNPLTKPRSMDFIVTAGPTKGKQGLAIYEMDGDTLKVCYAIDEPGRPTEFAGPKDKEWVFVVYKREKQ